MQRPASGTGVFPYRHLGSVAIYESPQFFYPRRAIYWLRSKIARTHQYIHTVRPLLNRVEMTHGKQAVNVARVERPMSPSHVDILQQHLPGIQPWQLVWLFLRFLEEGKGPFSAYGLTAAKVSPESWLFIRYNSELSKWEIIQKSDGRVRQLSQGTFVLFC